MNWSFRNKEKEGWAQIDKLELSDRVIYRRERLDPYTYTYLKGYSLRESCYNCQYCCSKRCADITVGDYWGISIHHPEFNNVCGVSLLLINTEKGRIILDRIKEEVKLLPSNYEFMKMHNSGLVDSFPRPFQREMFYRDFKRKTMDAFVRQNMKVPPNVWEIIRQYVPKKVRSVVKNKKVEYYFMKILHITYGFNGGGVGFVIANYCTNRPMPGIEFDIVGESIGKPHLLQERFEKAGFHTFYVTPKKENILKNIMEMYYIIQRGRYDAVHVHFEEWSFLYLWIAKICGVKIRICHAHMAYMTGATTKPYYKLFRKMLNRFATLRLACSKDAGEHLFGNNPYTVLNNAIEAEKYVFDPEKRIQIRKS